MNMNIEELKNNYPLIKKMLLEEIVWLNPDYSSYDKAVEEIDLSMEDINDAEDRLKRFAPFIMKKFPETISVNGMIESPLEEIENMKLNLNQSNKADFKGRLFLKEDNNLAIAGSVKARGGIYEILKYSEDLLLKNNLITKNDNYKKIAEPEIKNFFSEYSIHVGSTGNLGLSIGIISAALGYHVTVHMSMDAKQWKKDLLRSKGVNVMEYASDYSKAVEEGRKLSEKNPKSYFVDDENSVNLFLGYAVAAKRLVKQLEDKNIKIDKEHPLFIFIPCGVGGAPGGITFGLKQIFKDNVHCFFVEPTEAPCVLLGMMTKLNNSISVQDIGLTGKTCADGLAVGRPSKFVGKIMKRLLSGDITVSDKILYDYMRELLNSENIFIEPSSCAAFHGIVKLNTDPVFKSYLEKNDLLDKMENSYSIAWATGGSLVPEDIKKEYINTYL